MPRLEVYSDVICPWCYIGKRHMELALAQLADRGLHFEVSWRPFQLNPGMPKAGMDRAEYRRAKFGTADRSAALDRQVAEAAERAGLSIRHDVMRRTPSTLAAHRLIQYAAEEGCQDAVVDRLFAAYFAEGRDIGSSDVLCGLAVEAGLDAVGAAAFLSSGRLAPEVEAEDQAVRNAGLSGVPTFVLERNVLFSGAVPPDAFAEALEAAHRSLVGAAA